MLEEFGSTIVAILKSVKLKLNIILWLAWIRLNSLLNLNQTPGVSHRQARPRVSPS
jgi:hypothetical protein